MQKPSSLVVPDGTPCNGGQLRYYRQRRGWTQLELASRVGISERVVRKAEKGGRLRRETLEMLASALTTADETLTAADLTTDPLAVVQAFYRIYLEHVIDAPRLGQHLLHPDVVVTVFADGAGCHGTFVGVDGYERMIRGAFTDFELVREEPGQWYVSGGRVASGRRVIARPRGRGPEDEFATWAWNEYEVEGGRIVRVNAYSTAEEGRRRWLSAIAATT